METKILLGGGGSAEDERPVFELLASWVGTSGSVLYLPIALCESGRVYEGCLEWLASALNPLGVRQIEMWTNLVDHSPVEIGDHTAIFIGGGSTYSLLHQLRTAGFDAVLRDFVSHGGIIYGGSAGAIVLGHDISTCSHLDENTVGLTDTSGLDLLDGESVWCHYQATDDPLIRAYVEHTNSPTIALAETAGIWVRECKEYTPLGSGDIYRFTINRKHRLSQGC
ncbi:MAG: Type 1 glutamine amidotransferase-like domain-containing protein [Chloroflexi bacterium]|nr:Type 1 glutamine amidotransferase-like domain-containing protein [Chloroflexota bacterium]